MPFLFSRNHYLINWKNYPANIALVFIGVLAQIQAIPHSFAANDLEEVSVQVKSIPINVPSRMIELDLGIFSSVAYAISVEKPIVLHLHIRGEVMKEIGVGYRGIPKIEVIDNNTKFASPKWQYYVNSDKKNRTADALDVSFLLQKGNYTITLHGGVTSGFGQNTFEDDKLALQFTVESEQLTIPDWLPSVNTLLTEAGLEDEIGLVASFLGPNFRFSENGSDNNRAKSLIVHMMWSIMVQQSGMQNEWLTQEQYLFQLEQEKFFDNKLFVFFANQVNRDRLKELETGFYNTYQVELWNRLFRKITLHTGVPAKNIFGIVPVQCDGVFLYEKSPGFVNRSGVICQSSSSARDVPAWLASRLGIAASSTVEGFKHSFPTIVENYLATRMETIDGTLEYLYRDDSYVEAIVRGVRGWVIKGSNLWEKVQISFALIGNRDNAKIRIFLDGMLASGMGNTPPPDSRYTYSMEPNFASDITAFSQSMLDSFMYYREQD